MGKIMSWAFSRSSSPEARITMRRRQSELSEHVKEKLEAGQEALRKIRWQVSGTAAAVSVVSMFAIMVPPLAETLDMRKACRTDPVGHLLRVALWGCATASFLFSLLAPLPDDRTTTLWVFAAVVAILACDFATLAPMIGECGNVAQAYPECRASIFGQTEWCTFHMGCGMVGDTLFTLGLAISAVRGMCGTSVSSLQAGMWAAASMGTGLSLACALVELIATLVERKAVAQATMAFLVYGCIFPVTRSTQLVDQCHVWLKRIYNTHKEKLAAAGLAGLIGNCNVGQMLEEAVQNFRCIPWASLSPKVLLDNKAAKELGGLAQPAKLGHCDAFISHSWLDDPPAKWRALQSWHDYFVEREDRDPSLWLDKLCINQTNIEQDLRCLPVFLSGCVELVLLVGPEYPRRLWCAMELFTFVHMGGDVNRIKLVPVLREGQENHDMQLIHAAFATFDANLCDCSNPEDKERMTSIIRSAFGSLDEFNMCVRSITPQLPGKHRGQLGVSQAFSRQSLIKAGLELDSEEEDHYLVPEDDKSRCKRICLLLFPGCVRRSRMSL